MEARQNKIFVWTNDPLPNGDVVVCFNLPFPSSATATKQHSIVPRAYTDASPFDTRGWLLTQTRNKHPESRADNVASTAFCSATNHPTQSRPGCPRAGDSPVQSLTEHRTPTTPTLLLLNESAFCDNTNRRKQIKGLMIAAETIFFSLHSYDESDIQKLSPCAKLGLFSPYFTYNQNRT